MKLYAVIVSMFLLSFLIGCETDTKYVPPEKVEKQQAQQVAVQQETQPEQDTVQENIPEPTKEVKEVPKEVVPQKPKTTIFKVGETASDKELKVTLNNVDYKTVINEKGNEFLVARAPAGKTYAILDITVENALPDETQLVSTMTQAQLTDKEGYSYQIDFEALTALDKKFGDGEILPGMKKRGELGYLIPKDAEDLKFIFRYDMFTGTSAVFDLG